MRLMDVQKAAIRQVLVALRNGPVGFTWAEVIKRANQMLPEDREMDDPEIVSEALKYAREVGTPESQQPDSVVPVAAWEAPVTYTVIGEGLVVQRGGRVLLTVPPEKFPDLIARLAMVMRGIVDDCRVTPVPAPTSGEPGGSDPAL